MGKITVMGWSKRGKSDWEFLQGL